MAVDRWAKGQGLVLDGEEKDGSFVGATRLEIYHRDPDEEPDALPTTEVAFRIKD